MAWNFGLARRHGNCHEDGSCQDFAAASSFTIVDESASAEVLVAAIADGAGSALKGHIGAEVAVTTMCGALQELCTKHGECTRDLIHLAFAKTCKAVSDRAEQEKSPISELSCTLLGVVSFPEETFFYQIGDGAAVYRLGSDYHVAIWPAESEFVNTTLFVTTPSAENLVEIRRVAGQIDEVVLFTDGIQYIVLDHRTKLPHVKFFASVSEAFGEDELGQSDFYSKWLTALLDSDHIQTRTDDDTSIVFAKRWGSQ